MRGGLKTDESLSSDGWDPHRPQGGGPGLSRQLPPMGAESYFRRLQARQPVNRGPGGPFVLLEGGGCLQREHLGPRACPHTWSERPTLRSESPPRGAGGPCRRLGGARKVGSPLQGPRIRAPARQLKTPVQPRPRAAEMLSLASGRAGRRRASRDPPSDAWVPQETQELGG